jgi:hypothetical protein
MHCIIVLLYYCMYIGGQGGGLSAHGRLRSRHLLHHVQQGARGQVLPAGTYILIYTRVVVVVGVGVGVVGVVV